MDALVKVLGATLPEDFARGEITPATTVPM